jgi:hypothetical protein
MNVTGIWICSISQIACVKYGYSSVFHADVRCCPLLSLCVIDVCEHSKVTCPPHLVMSRPYMCQICIMCRGTDFNCDVCIWPLICMSPTSHSVCLWHTHTHTHTHAHTEHKNLIWIWDPVLWLDRWRDNCLTRRVISTIMIHSPLQLLGGIVKRGILVHWSRAQLCAPR